jgi:tetratricopeptide (TPR) repeat protein
LGDAPGAIKLLSELAAREPNAAIAHLELGLAYGQSSQGSLAIGALARALQLRPQLPEAWSALAQHALAVGDDALAEHAQAQYLRWSARDPRLAEAASALLDNKLAVAETLLREHLIAKPTDAAAIRMLAELAARLGRYGDAENLLARCLEIAPGFRAAQQNLAFVLHRQNKSDLALQQIDALLAKEPRNPSYRNLKAAILARIGDVHAALAIYEPMLKEYPQQARIWMSYGHALKTAGRQADAIAAYRQCASLQPQLGEAWWSLANLKTVQFSAQDLDTMRAQLGQEKLSPDDALHFHFAMGKALEDAADYAQAFDHYSRGNALRRASIRYDAAEITTQVDRASQLFMPTFFAARRAAGCLSQDPIFIVGLPRSGSTLLEQILASHSLVEGTQELPDIQAIARDLGGRKTRSAELLYPECLASLTAQDLRRLGERYLQSTRIHRKTERPFFIDKMPNNWLHIGLIHLILPKAKIIDARRHPLGCCWSAFKQHFARGQHFSYDLNDVGRYYSDYVRFMAHFDAVLPGRVHRVIYEQVVDDLEAQVRLLLAYCGLEYEPSCLQFHRTERAVRTASSEQVRQPLFRDAVDHWRHFEPWLEPLKSALGPVLADYPTAPTFAA